LKIGLREVREKAFIELQLILSKLTSEGQSAVKDYKLINDISILLGKLEFLVNKKTLEMVKELKQDIFEFRKLNAKLKKLDVGKKRNEIIDIESELYLKIINSYEKFIKEFKKYLYVGNIGAEE
jgi:hypothetical protein